MGRPKTKKDKLPILWGGALTGPPDGRQTFKIGASSVVMAVTGNRGDGKTLFLAYLAAKALASGLPVWSNFHVAFELRDPDNKKFRKRCETMPLESEEFYSLDERVSGGVALFDELGYYVDARVSGQLRNRIFGYALRQCRKRNLSIYYSVNDIHVIDKRVRNETDFHIKTRDAARTTWGLQETDLQPGEMFFISIGDITGMLTGQPWSKWAEETGHWERMRYQFYGKPFWPIYHTEEVVDPFAASSKVEVLTDSVKVDRRSNKAEDALSLLENTIEICRQQGITEVDTQQFWQTAGIPVNMQSHYARYLQNMGVTKEIRGSARKRIYVLPDGNGDQVIAEDADDYEYSGHENMPDTDGFDELS